MVSYIPRAILYVIITVILALALFCLLDIASSLFINPNKIYMHNSSFYRFLLYATTFLTIIVARIHIHKEGLNKLSEAGINCSGNKQRFLLVSNHRSNFDPILTWHVLRKYDLAFLSKEENMHIFTFGKIIRKCCFMAIDRENPKKALETLIKSSELIKNDEVSIAIYPEGTRNKGEGLLPFHNGIFKVAKMAEVPIVVMSITGTERIHKNFPLRKTNVNFKILDVIDVDKVMNLKTSELGEIVREKILYDIQ